MNSWNDKDSCTPVDANHTDSILDNFCSMSEPDDSGHFTASPEADGCGESIVEIVDMPPSPSRPKKAFSRHRGVSSEGNYEFEDDSCMSTMSAPGVLRGITKCLEKSANSPHHSDSDDNLRVTTDLKKELTSYPNTYLGEVLHDFNSMFKEKLQYIDKASRNADTHTKILMMERRNEVLEQWAKDVCSQNMLLVHTVEELEEEANRKVKTLQAKINATTNLARSHMDMIQQYEKQVEELINEQSTSQKKYEILTYQHMEVSKSYKTVQQRMKVLENDNDSLRSLICRIRDMGVWDVNGLQLQPRTYDMLFGLYPNLAGSEVQTVFTREKARNIIDTEVKSKEMETYITELREAKREVDSALDEKEKTVITLEAEVKSLSTVLKHYQCQCDDLKKVLEETQDKLIQVTNKSNQHSVETKEELTSAMTRRDQDIRDMLNELRDLKTQLNKACDERQSAIYEAKMLKRELGDRTSEMLEMRNILQIIQNEAECTRSAVQNVQEKQDHLSILKDQVHSYQDKYEQAQTLLASKGEIIQSLQQQMSMLHEKVIHMENQTYSPISSYAKKECGKAEQNLTSTAARNLIPSIIDNSVSAALKRFELTAKERVAKMFEESSDQDKKKPAWTTHFTKGSIQSSEPSSSLQKIRNIELKPTASKGNVSKEVPEKAETKKPAVTTKAILANKSTKKSQLIRAVTNVEKAKTERVNGLRKFTDKRLEHLSEGKDLKLPKLSLAQWAQNNDQNKSHSPKSGGLGNERLPSLTESIDKAGDSGLATTKVPTDNPMVQRSSLHNLIEVAIGNKKSFLKDSPYKISPTNARRSRSSPRNEGEKSKSEKADKDKLCSDLYSKDKKPRSKSSSAPSDAVTFSRSRLNVQSSGELNSLLPCASWDAEEILQQLPQQSNDVSVKNWIASSSKTCLELNKKMKAARSKYSLSGNSSPSNTSRNSLRKRKSAPQSNKERQLPIYSLEDEWDKTMAKVTRRSTAMKDTYLEEPTETKACESVNGDLSESIRNGHEEIREESPNELEEQSVVVNNNNIIHLDDQTAVLKKSALHKLKEEFDMEKEQIEKNHLEELRVKDIEITMQKLKLKLGELNEENENLLWQAEMLDARISQHSQVLDRQWEENQLELGLNVLEAMADSSLFSNAYLESHAESEHLLINTISELQFKLAEEKANFQRLEQGIVSEYNEKISIANELISELEEQLSVVKYHRMQMVDLFQDKVNHNNSVAISEYVQTDILTSSLEEIEMTFDRKNDCVKVAEEKLLELKGAYDSNEEILQNKLSQYSEYIEKLRSKIISNDLQICPEAAKEELVYHLKQSAQYFKLKNQSLLSEKEALSGEVKLLKKRLHKSVKELTKLRDDNLSMKSSISSLSLNIEQLTDENEKLLQQIHEQHRHNPCTAKRDNRTLEKGCGDSCKCEHSASSEISSSPSASFLSNILNMSNENGIYSPAVVVTPKNSPTDSSGTVSHSMRSKIPRLSKAY